MPMNPRLLRPILSGDPDARRYIAAVQQADQQSLEPAVRKAITDFVTGCKADGIWSAIKASCILAGARTLSGALVPLVGTAPTNNNFVSGDYNRETGLLGDGSTKYLDSNRANNADPQNSKHVSVYIDTLPTSGANQFPRILSSGTSLANDSFLHRGQNNGTFLVNVNSASAGALSAAAGFVGLSRVASSSFTGRVSGGNQTLTTTSGTPSTTNIGLFANPSSPAQYAAARIAFYSIGESLNLALLDTRVSALIAAIGAAI